MYYDARKSFLLFIFVYLFITFMPRPQAWFEGFIIHKRFLSAFSRAI